MNLFLDFDSTLVNSNEAMVNLFNRKYNKNYSVENLKKYDFRDLFPEVDALTIHRMFSSKELFDEITFVKNSLEVITKYSEFYNIQIVTKSSEPNRELKAEWISKHIPDGIISGVTYIDMVDSKRSMNMKGGIFIDDHIHNIRESNAKVRILFAQYPKAEWSKIDNLDEVYVVSTWNEIASTLEFYKNIGGVI